MQKSQYRIGAHLSVAGGLKAAVDRVISMGGNALQIFSGSPRGWARKSVDPKQAEIFRQYCKDHDVSPVVIHALYLVNLTGDREELLRHSIEALEYDLQYSAHIGAEGVVVHLGSHLGKGFDAVFDTLIENLKEILDRSPENSTLLIENSAGQEGKLCSDFAEIHRIYDALHMYVEKKRLAWCFDTCHGFAAGYDLRTVHEEMKKHGLLGTLRVIHFNDSRDPFNSGRDRHENIGEGQIGKVILRDFLKNPHFSQIPFIIEVPGFDGSGPDEKNIARVKELLC
ncbi:MAG TPA: deoxyribonuclease IV [Patescibacteria group bacterium]|nr:deoxyribonuclease IV [Patescibacteria group bacterium]